MKYCKNCGAELAEGVSFCEKCGNPVGQDSKSEEGEKKGGKALWIAILAGLTVIAIGTVGVLFATDVIGNKGAKEAAVVKDGNETDAVAQEISDAAEEKDSAAETDSAPAAESSKSELAERAWKAYSAYVEELRKPLEAYEDYKRLVLLEESVDDWDSSEYGFPVKRCDGYFALFYMDADDYPELLCGIRNPVLLTYKNGKVISVYYDGEDIGEEDDEYNDGDDTTGMSFPLSGIISGGNGFSCKERQNSLYVWDVYASGGGSSYDYFYALDEDDNRLKTTWSGVERNLNEAWENPEERTVTSNGSTGEVTEKEYKEQLAQQKGDEYSWINLMEDGNTNSASGKTIFEAWYVFADRNHFYSN